MTEYTAEQIKENRRKWVEALRGGEYRQAYRALRSFDGRLCCLGVLNELVGCKWEPAMDGSDRFITTESNDPFATPRAMAFVGLRTLTGRFNEPHTNSLSVENDSGKSFADIADIIEREPHGLFLPLPV